MAYFPNGTSGEMYFDRYCARCIHRDGPDGDSGCAVWLAHLLANYAECNNDDSILHVLIPRSKDKLDNEQCLMFAEREKAACPVCGGDMNELSCRKCGREFALTEARQFPAPTPQAAHDPRGWSR